MKNGCLICDQQSWFLELNSVNLEWDNLSVEMKVQEWEKLKLEGDDALIGKQIRMMDEQLSLVRMSETLKPIHQYQDIISKYSLSCDKCENIPLVCIMGRTGSGKSTILNILAGCKPSYRKSSTGTKELYFEKGVTDVNGKISSQTRFCHFFKLKDAIYVDFAGFFDTRTGQLQMVQHLLMNHITTSRAFKILAVKDIRTSRDLAFFDFLLLDWIHKENTLVVMTHTQPDHEIDWKVYGEGKIHKDFMVVMMGLAIKGSDYNTFKSTLAEKIKKLHYSNDKIVLGVSPEVFQFQNKSIEHMKRMIDLELFRILSESLPRIIIQPYDVEYYRDVFDGQYSIKESVAILGECGLITVHTDTTTLDTLERNWSLLIPFADDSSADYQNWGQITPSSKQLLVNFYSKLNEYTNVDLLPLEGNDLVKDLIAFNQICHTHHLEHVSFKSRALKLLADEFGFKELQRLASFRQEYSEKIFRIWLPLKNRVLEAISAENSDETSGNFFKIVNLNELVDIVEEIDRFSRTNQSDFEKISMVLSPFLRGFAYTDVAVAAYLWVSRLSVNASTSTKIVVPVLTTTAVVFGFMTTAAASGVFGTGAFAYHIYRVSQELQIIRGLGLDFSFFRVEAQIWSYIKQSAKNQSVPNATNQFAKYEKEFRLFMKSTKEGALRIKRIISNSISNGPDISDWNLLVENILSMSTGIFVEIKARGRSTRGCHFHEHEWIKRSLISIDFDALSCCGFSLIKQNLICKHCGFISHSRQECKLLALQVACKSLIRAQNVKRTSPFKSNIQKWNQDVQREANSFSNNQDVIYAAYLCKTVINDHSIVSDEYLYIHQNEFVKYLMINSGSTCFVILSNTFEYGLSKFISNSNSVLKFIGLEKECSVHSGMLEICELIYDHLWDRLVKSNSARVVIAGYCIGGSIAHVFHLKSLLDQQNPKSLDIVSIGFGSPMTFDNKTSMFVNPDSFINFVTEFDPIPSIVTAEKYLKKEILKKLKLKVPSGIDNDITRSYAISGKYIFLDKLGWETDELKKIEENLKVNLKMYDIEQNKIDLYYSKVVDYLENRGFDQREP